MADLGDGVRTIVKSETRRQLANFNERLKDLERRVKQLEDKPTEK